MGYSGRYHAASLAAVFVALAIGILVGIALADDVVSSASDELEATLRGDRDEAQDEAEALTAELEQEREFGERIGPALVFGRLARERVGLLSLGDLPDDDTVEEVEQAVAAGGGDLTSIAVLSLPPDLPALAQAAGGRFADGDATPAELGTAIGRQLMGGGPLIERIRDELFVRFTGDLSGVDRAVLVARPPEELQGDLSGDERAFTSAMLGAIDETAAGSAGVERSTTDPTTLMTASNAGIATVDNIDQESGQVSLVFALDGAEGDFGTKEAATSLLPELPGSALSP